MAEVVKIYWPSPAGAKVYAWWDLLADPVFANSDLETWLDGAPLIPAFIAQDEAKTERFHEIPRTAAIGDDVVRMRFTNHDGAFEALCATHRAGVKVEIFYLLCPIGDAGSLAIEDGSGEFAIEDGSGEFAAEDVSTRTMIVAHWFSGHLRTPDNVDKDFVEITVSEGLRSADLLLPNRVHASQCTWASQFGGLFDPLLTNNPCDYDRHTGGSRGLLNGADPFTSCDGTKASCTARMGDLLSYGGFDAVQDTSLIGFGSNQTQSKTNGQANRMVNPVQVVYGETQCNELPILDYAPEINLSHPDEGTMRTLVEVSEGPIEEITDVEVMGMLLPRPDGLGLQTKLGTQQQTATTFSANVLNYNRLAHFRGDVNPTRPNGIRANGIPAQAKVKGRNTVRVYSDADTYTEEYTNLRAWVMLDLMTDTVYGHREAIGRHHIPDLIYLANTTGTTFNGVVQGKSAQQQITDICLGGKWFLPFMHKDANQTLAQWRWLPIEEYDLEADDIPTFTDTGANRNILKDARGLSRIKVSRRDDDKIPNEWTLTFSDAQHKYLERPLLFADSDAQKRAGEVYGDGSLRKVPDTETAFGVTDETEAREVGFYLLDYGRFFQGGIKNNGTVEFVTSHLLWPEALDLHQNKVVKIVSDKLDNLKDPDGNVFTHFVVTAMQTTSRGELIVTCQAFGALRTVEPPAAACGNVTWEHPTGFTIDGNTVTGELGSGSSLVAYVQTAEAISQLYQYFEFSAPNVGDALPDFYVFLTEDDNPACTLDGGDCVFPVSDYCFHFTGNSVMAGTGGAGDEFVDGNTFEHKPTRLYQFYYSREQFDNYYVRFLVDNVPIGKVLIGATEPSPLRLAVVAGAQDGLQPVVTAKVYTGEYPYQNEAAYLAQDSCESLEFYLDSILLGTLPIYRLGDLRLMITGGGSNVGYAGQSFPKATAYCSINGGALEGVTWEEAVNVTVTGETVELVLTTETDYRDVCRAQSSQTFQADGDYFQFTLPNMDAVYDTPQFYIGVTEYDAPISDDITGIEQNGYWRPEYYFYTAGSYAEAIYFEVVTNKVGAVTIADSLTRTEESVFKIVYRHTGTAVETTTGGAVTETNTTLTSPIEYSLTIDQTRRTVTHTWIHLAGSSLALNNLHYEIRLDAGGNPDDGAPLGALVFFGYGNSYTEAVNVEGERTYWFRVLTSGVAGNWEARTINVDYTTPIEEAVIIPAQLTGFLSAGDQTEDYDPAAAQFFM